MKIRFLFALALLLAVCCASFAQTVTVKPRTVVYKRTGKNVPAWKRTFEVRYPMFSGRFTPAALRSLRSGTDYWRVFDTKLSDNLRDDHWLSSFDYTVKYNKHNLLAIWLMIEGVGAYPDNGTKYLVFDTRYGKKLEIKDLFETPQLDGLRDLIRDKMRSQEASLDAEAKEELSIHRESEITAEFHPGPDKLELRNLDGFSVNDAGVTFFYDYGYPHVAQALEPSGEFFIPYIELKPFVRTDGLLARFVR